MKPRILVVEDELDMFKALAIRLDANGFDTQLATSVATSVAMVRIDPPDLIVLDLGLPDGDGYTVMEKLKSLLSAPAAIGRGAKLSADRGLVKPREM